MSSEIESTRRQFLAGAIGMAALGGLSFSGTAGAAEQVIENQPQIDPDSLTTKEHVTDVLVIGGGMAGFFAAVKAADQGAKVILTAKGRLGASGQTPWARDIFAYYPARKGMSLKEWIKAINIASHRTSNPKFTRQLANHSLARVNDLKKWGFFDSSLYSRCFHHQLKKRKVETCERIMITHLIKERGRVIGAGGFALDDGTLHFFSAKTVVLATGAGAFKPAGLPICDLTSDGAMMAWRIGARITGKEWSDTTTGMLNAPAATWQRWRKDLARKPQVCGTHVEPTDQLALHYEVWKEGAILPGLPDADKDQEVKQFPKGPAVHPATGEEPAETEPGQKPKVRHAALSTPFFEQGPPSGGAGAGLAPHNSEGLAPVDLNGLSTIPGLYAAGDALGSCVTGALELQQGASLSAAAVQGAIAGTAAARVALRRKSLTAIPADQKIAIREEILAPLKRSRGFSPRWVTQTLQGIIIPNFILYIKKERMLEAALAYVEELRDNHQPLLIARTLHELRLAHETANMILNAEMKLRASILRRESRCTHYRVDYPRSNDRDWDCWINIFQTDDGAMGLEIQPFNEGPAT
jgi:succinate dehydrogenase/fumarate reductase flavoprotein subunit